MDGNIVFIKELEKKSEEARTSNRYVSLFDIITGMNIKFNCTLSFKLEIADILLKYVKKIHDHGYLCLGLNPHSVYFKCDFTGDYAVEDVALTDLYNVVELTLANSRTDYKLNDGFSSDELCIHVKYDPCQKIDIHSDIYSLIKICRFILYENEKLDRIFVNNGVIDYLSRRFLEKGEKLEPSYRYESIDKMIERLVQINNANNFYLNDDYINLFDLAYECGMHWRDVKLVVKAVAIDKYEDGLLKIDRRLTTDEKFDYNEYHTWYVHKLFDDLYVRHINQMSNIRLFINGIRANNNVGNTSEALALFFRLKELTCNEKEKLELFELYAPSVSSFMDRLKYSEALNLLDEALYDINLYEQNNIVPFKVQKKLYLYKGRLYSAKACVNIFNKSNKTEIMNYFSKAIDYFEKVGDLKKTFILNNFDYDTHIKWLAQYKGLNNEDCINGIPKIVIANIFITRCHILQYACECNDKDLYEKTFKLYFNVSVFDALKGYIYNWELFNSVYGLFGLFALMKGIHCFYIADKSMQHEIKILIEELAAKVIIPENINKNNVRDWLGYPLILIEYYFALIELKLYGEVNEIVNSFFLNALSCSSDAFTGEKNINAVIWYNVLWNYNKIIGKDAENTLIFEKLKESCKSENWNELYTLLIERGTLEGILRFEYS